LLHLANAAATAAFASVCCSLNHGPMPWQLLLDVFTAG